MHHIYSSFTDLMQMPWRITNNVRRLMMLPYIRFIFWLNGVKWGSHWQVYGIPIIQRHRLSSIQLGDKVQLRSSTRSNPLVPYHPVVLATRRKGSRILIGESVGITGGTICADTYIEIGDRTILGANCIIADTDFHPLSPSIRQEQPNNGKTAPVIIKSDVFIGMQSVILKGVTLGEGCVVGACSVVTHDVPPRTIVAGNPAKIVGTI